MYQYIQGASLRRRLPTPARLAHKEVNEMRVKRTERGPTIVDAHGRLANAKSSYKYIRSTYGNSIFVDRADFDDFVRFERQHSELYKFSTTCWFSPTLCRGVIGCAVMRLR